MHTPHTKKTFIATLLIGSGVMAAVDEIIFHQLLNWHHFYDLSTPRIGLIADGLLHAAELIAIVAGFFMFSRLRQSRQMSAEWAKAGFFLGAGGFQVFDGIFVHKVLRLHQIRYDVNILPYDITWLVSGALLLLIGAWFYLQAHRQKPVTPYA